MITPAIPAHKKPVRGVKAAGRKFAGGRCWCTRAYPGSPISNAECSPVGHGCSSGGHKALQLVASEPGRGQHSIPSVANLSVALSTLAFKMAGGLDSASPGGDGTGQDKLLLHLQAHLPLHFEALQLPSKKKVVGLVVVDEVNGFCTVGCGNLVRCWRSAHGRLHHV